MCLGKRKVTTIKIKDILIYFDRSVLSVTELLRKIAKKKKKKHTKKHTYNAYKHYKTKQEYTTWSTNKSQMSTCC